MPEKDARAIEDERQTDAWKRWRHPTRGRRRIPPKATGDPRPRGQWRRQHGYHPRGPFAHRARLHHPGGVFVRLVFVFGAFVALTVGALALFVNVIRVIVSASSAGTGGLLSRPAILIGSGVLLLAGVGVAAVTVGRRAFRTVAEPLADLMSAAEAVTQGDLSVRVPERHDGRFTEVARTFNAMIASLERADQQRRNLTADVAHELRTPLQVIQGNLEGVLDGVYTPTDTHINATLEATHQLGRLVEDLRTLSLAESGQLPLSLEPVDVRELLLDTQTSFAGQAEAAGIDLRVAIDETDGADEPFTVEGDPGRLDQVLANLVVNAIRHTPSGGAITLEAGSTPEGTRICVRDTGEGIAPEDLPFVFDRFWRGDRARTHKAGTGSGLGLAITRQLVRLHGGTIAVASVLGEGTTFTVTLPR